MFGIGMPEMLLILAVALIIIGPKKLPDLAKTLGKALGDFKRATNDIKESIEVETGLDEVRNNITTVKNDLNASISLTDEAPDVKTATPVPDDTPEAPSAKANGALDDIDGGEDKATP